jgi:RHS repeat-associated protein
MAKASAGPLKMNVAHNDSSHVAPGPPCPSGGPAPTPTGTFVPVPYMYMARSRTLHQYTGAPSLKVDKVKALVKGSYTDVEQPANVPAKPGEFKPTGADLTNMAIVGVGQTTQASGNVKSGSDKVCVTMDLMNLCLPGEKRGSIHQSEGTLLNAASPRFSAAQAKKHAARVKRTGDPVAVVSGAVLDEADDLFLPGAIDLAWTRSYSSLRRLEVSPLGKGGWTHAFDQWIDVHSGLGRAILRDQDGSDVELPLVEKRSSAFVRRGRLTVRRSLDEYEIFDHESRLTRVFSPLAPGGRPMLQRVRDAWNNRIELRYEEGRLVEVTDTAGRSVRLLHDDRGRVRRVEVWAAPPAPPIPGVVPDPPELRQWVDYGYSEDGDLARATDALGNEHAYAYDAHHRLEEKRLPTGLAFRYTYDEDDRCTLSRADGGLHRVELIFDPAQRTTIVHGTPEPREYVWSDRGEILVERLFDKSASVTRTYDPDGYVLSEENAAGEALVMAYDDLGNMVEAVLPDGRKVLWEFRDDLMVKHVDACGRASTFEHDARGACVRETSPTGRAITFAFDVHGRCTEMVGPGGPLVAYKYDAHHNIVAETDARGATWAYAYDPMGRMTSRTDPLGRVHRFTYDLLGRPTREDLPDGSAVTYAWDALGNVVEIGDEHGHVDRTEYAGTGVAARRTLADGTSWQLGHDVLERLREVRTPKGDVHRMRYDRMGQLVEEQSFDGAVTRYQYSKRGLLARVEYADETWIEYEYDDAGAVIAESSPHGTRTFERDERGYVVRAVVDEHGGPVVAELAWDDDGHLVSERVNGREVRYTYDEKTGELASRTLPNGEVTRYFLEAGGLLTALDHEGEKILLQRDLLGRELRRHFYATGVDLLSSYDVNDRLVGLVAVKPPRPPAQAAGPLLELKWRYGPHARLAAMFDGRWGVTSFEHDAFGRLVAARRPGAEESYAYDAAGSVEGIYRAPDEPREPWSLGAGNRLARTARASYAYDARGRRRRRVDRDGSVTEYVWDCRGQLREVLLPGGGRLLFKYDAFGRRCRKVELTPKPAAARDREAATLAEAAEMSDFDVRVVDYVWDHDELAMEIDSARGTRVFVHEPGSFVPLLHREGGQTYAYVTDPLGVPLALLDREGEVAWSASRSAWGGVGAVWRRDPPPGEPPASTPFRLLGQYFDDETGLAYTMHRYFDAETARWLSPDPMPIEESGPNVFGFDGSPTERVDPLGLFTPKTFQQFLNKTNKPRRMANRASKRFQRGRLVGAASRRWNRDQPGAAGGTARGNGTLRGHAEREPLRQAQGLGGGNQSGVGAIGASSAHCGACTNAMINTPGTTTASRIKGAGVDPFGVPNNGWNPPALPNVPGSLW